MHAEYAVVPVNLLAHLPDEVDFESAAFTTLGAIALHGFRLAEPQLGERVAVIGLGLLDMVSVWAAASVGAFLGDSFSYALGRRFRRQGVETGDLEQVRRGGPGEPGRIARQFQDVVQRRVTDVQAVPGRDRKAIGKVDAKICGGPGILDG